MSAIKKLKYLFRGLSFDNPYTLYWFDLLTEKGLKKRTGECIDCINCCHHPHYGFCKHADEKLKRCRVYDKRKCNIWFPISQKELDLFKKHIPGFTCKFSFKKNENRK